MQIPLIDLKRQYAAIQAEAEAALCSVLASGSYIMGANVQAFEEEFAAYCGVKHAISVGNGTDALVISLEALGIGPGDEVITTPFTFFATAESISAVGATPVFVDIRPDTYNLDENLIEAAITDKTRAIMPVHIFGQPCEMDKINDIAAKHNLYIIEDACQAVSAEYQGKKTGTLADIACFSFFPTKNLSCAGDGGMITTNNDRLAAICRALRTHGSGEAGQKAYKLLRNIDAGTSDKPAGDNTVYNPLKYYNYLIGHNSRLDELQAALLRIKLRKLDEYQKQREDHARYYNEALQESDLQRPVAIDNLKHAWHLYILQSENRPAITEYLNSKGIATGIYYPVPLHLQKAYTELGYQPGDLPVAECLSHRTFAIPCFPELTAEKLAYIVAILKEASYINKSAGEKREASPSPLTPHPSPNNFFVHESSYIDEPCQIGTGTKIWHFSHIMQKSQIGENCNIGQNVVISPGVVLGNGVKVQNNVSIYSGVICEDDVFLGPSMVFTNVINPRSFIERKNEFKTTLIKKGATIGANATIICGHTIGRYALIGAGAVVSKDVPDYALLVGNPAQIIGYVCRCGQRLSFNEVGQAQCPSCTERYTYNEQSGVSNIG